MDHKVVGQGQITTLGLHKGCILNDVEVILNKGNWDYYIILP